MEAEENNKKPHFWSNEDIELLKNNFINSTNEELTKTFPYRTLKSIQTKASKLKLSNGERVRYFKRNTPYIASQCHSNKHELHKAYKTPKGYITRYNPNCSRANKQGRAFEHISIWEEATGIPVRKDMCIHHLNGDKSDNRLSNLCMMIRSAHIVHHHLGIKESETTSQKISEKAKARLANPKNHPMYKNIDVSNILIDRNHGMIISDVCKKYEISNSTYYRKIKEYQDGKLKFE